MEGGQMRLLEKEIQNLDLRWGQNKWSQLHLNGHLHTRKTRGESHYGLAIYIKKDLKAKEELWKLK
jgi:hypothetical protein